MRAEKKYLIDEVTTHLKKSDYVIVASYDKMNVQDIAKLRANSLLRRPSFTSLKTAPSVLRPRLSACLTWRAR